MENDLVVWEELVIPGRELTFQASRSGGPGGQHVNKTSSRATLTWSVASTSALDPEALERLISRLGSRVVGEGVVKVNVDEERSQHRNRETARARLAEIVRDALEEPKARIESSVPRCQKKKRRSEKLRRSALKRFRRAPVDDE